MTDDKILMQHFTAQLNQEPNPAEFELTPDGKARTLPISFVEMTLDEIFLGQWETSEPHFQQIFNEVVGTVVLTVTHPVTKQPIRRTGWASVVIMQDKDATIADFNVTKKKNALDLSFPKLGAEALKNAAKSLGKVFGRDINRKSKDTFKPTLKSLTDIGFKALLERVEKGDKTALLLARENFILDDTQLSILDGYDDKPKQLN